MTPSITQDVEAFLAEATIPLRLACYTPAGWPLVLSLWYLCREQRLFCATQETARVVSYLTRNPRCGFEVSSDAPPYCGVRGWGLATVDAEKGPEILKRLLVRYLGGCDNPLSERLLSRSDSEVALIIEPVRLFTWNYTERMRGSLAAVPEKRCPD